MPRRSGRLRNNLLNITTRDPIFNVLGGHFADRIAAYFARVEKNPAAAGLLQLPQVKIALADAYFMHYSAVPIVREEENPDPLLEKVRNAMAEYMATDAYHRLHYLTMLDENLSSLYATRFAKKLVEKLMEQLGNSGDQELLGLLSSLQDLGYRLWTAKRRLSKHVERRDLQAQIAAIAQQAADKIAGIIDPSAITSAAEEAASEVEKVAEAAKSLEEAGGRSAGKTATSYETLDKAMERLGVDTTIRILRTAGSLLKQLPQLVKIRKAKSRHGDPHGYTATSNPEAALPRELAMPGEVFYAKLASHSLLALDRRTSGEGAYYVLLDKSGSMEGDRTIVARSIALAILELARRRGRRYYLRFFDVEAHPLLTEREAADRLLTVKSDGGTKIDHAVRTALRDLTTLSEKTNTIILITDGEDTVTITRDELQRHSAELITIIQGSNDTLKEISTHYYNAITEQNAVKLVKTA